MRIAYIKKLEERDAASPKKGNSR
jgi:hypothetical protein